MPKPRNFLLGQGEKLAERTQLSRGGGSAGSPYTLAEQRRTLTPKVAEISRQLSVLPSEARPGDEGVALLTLHPAFGSKSTFPTAMLNAVGLRPIGSRPATVTPKKWTRKGKPVPCPSTELFVAGSRSAFTKLGEFIADATEDTVGSGDILKVEDVRTQAPEERIKSMPENATRPLMEIVLHAGNDPRAAGILKHFQLYLNSMDIPIDIADRIDSGQLSFIPVSIPKEKVRRVARFAFLRTARQMPRLRQLNPLRSHGSPSSFPATLPPGKKAMDQSIKVAIFDGGCPDVPELRAWVRRIKGKGVKTSDPEFQSHGLGVTSAVLFGPLKNGVAPGVPYARVDHYRVLDEDTRNDPDGELYPVLRRIIATLKAEKYDFVVLCIGPDLPVDDDDLNPWTTSLDEIFSNGMTLPFCAVGNNGDADHATGLDRVQPPSDGVNVLGIGAVDSEGPSWRRTSYSAIGPSRSPGLITPDCGGFGGDEHEPFFVLSEGSPLVAVPDWGTSYATPYVARMAIGVRASLGPVVNPLALKALLLHACEHRPRELTEVGWGRVPGELEELMTCPSGVVRVIYQGYLESKRYLRAGIPIPRSRIPGKVVLKATLCIATGIDSQNPLQYTRSGLEVFFRRDRDNVKPGKKNPVSTSFFTAPKVGVVVKSNAHEWETVRQGRRSMVGATLKNPAFDIHFNPRQAGHDVTETITIPYAMVVSIEAPHVRDFYDQIVNRYRLQLKPLRPRTRLVV
jgi:Subtilase family